MGSYSLSREDIAPLLEGLAILGTGGGGSPELGKAILENDFAMGRRPTLVSLDEVNDEATVVSGGMMGSVKVLEAMGVEHVMDHWEERFELLEVMRVMEGILGRKIDHVVPFEVGGLNTPAILSLGARMRVDVIDGDGSGRSTPETQMASFIGFGISLTPMPLVDFEGNVVIAQEAAEPTYADELGRWVITKGGGTGANAHYPMTGTQAKEAIVPNTVSGALELGRRVLEARHTGGDPVAAATEFLKGVPLFVGAVERLEEEEKMGFYYTVARLRGTGRHDGSVARLTIKNETMMLSVDNVTNVIFPDRVCMLEPDTGRGVMAVELREGVPLVLIGAPCHPRLRRALESEVGALAFSPSRYGYPEMEYLPIETLVEGFD